jgi:uncharacterized protein (TIGR03083 family)
MDETPGWDHERYCDAVALEAALFMDAVRGVDPATPVPTCPGWTFADLVRHHGTTHLWVGRVVLTRAQQRIWSRDVDVDFPADAATYPRWLSAGVEVMLGVLRATDPDTPVWTVGVGGRAGFWPRRMLFEGIVHRADAELALGRVPEIDPAAAADGVAEFLTNLAHPGWVDDAVWELSGEGSSLHLHATDREADADGEWTVRLDPGGYSWRREHPATAAVTVEGTAADLLLLTYGRLPVDARFAVAGDRDLLARWLERTAFR